MESIEAQIPTTQPEAGQPRGTGAGLYRWLVVASFVAGLLSSYLAWGRQPASPAPASSSSTSSRGDTAGSRLDVAALMKQVNPAAGYKLPVRYGDLGPRLLAGGAIDYAAFAAVFEQGGDPLTAAQVQALKAGSDEPIVITQENAHFLLDFFWAVGLANQNTILTDGPMVQNSGGRFEQFASTGGWTLAAKPVKELYASLELIPLTELQQSRVEEVAAAIYRPCCGNSTLFPDCNHGMAMLGLLELMASQDASVEQMFTAAKYVNAYWFPQQTLETAIFLKASKGVDFTHADARTVTGEQFASGQGYGQVHAALQGAGLLPQAPDGGGSCGS
jgi:hypothetical protein